MRTLIAWTTLIGCCWGCCPDGWVKDGSFCWWLSYPETATWIESEVKCQEMAPDAHLVHPRARYGPGFYRVARQVFPRAPRGGMQFWYGAGLTRDGVIQTTQESDVPPTGLGDTAPRPSCMLFQVYGKYSYKRGPAFDRVSYMYDLRPDFTLCHMKHYFWCVKPLDGDDNNRNIPMP